MSPKTMKEKKVQTKDELVKALKEKEESLHNFRFGISGSKIRNVREGRNTRRAIARIKTSLSGVIE